MNHQAHTSLTSYTIQLRAMCESFYGVLVLIDRKTALESHIYLYSMSDTTAASLLVETLIQFKDDTLDSVTGQQRQ